MATTLAILGGGAIGQLLAMDLCQHRHSPLLLTRPETTARIIQHQLQRLDGSIQQASLPHAPSNQPQHCDAVLVTTKAYQAESALTPVLAWLPPSTPIVLLHNGMGPQQRLAQRFPEHNWWAGMLTDGALKLESHSVRHTGQGVRYLGPLSGQGQLPDALTEIGFISEAAILPRLWQKLAVNALINPLTACYGCTNGELARPGHRAELQRLSDELAAVAKAEGIAMEAEQILAWCLSVAEATCSNRSSMLQDVSAKRPTEIDAISGFVVERARAHGLCADAHRHNLDRVSQLSGCTKT
ncbi:ketopantoate reductase [Ferrimonas sediminum]|uniref:2-dehydropantoate 2-reductase n=1 Tax=Ferrimonas sediminum TaxID=718193 RepID=A0A1G9AWI8_9GAMM|nr:2-dehydropantoate 2-reductase [Ferrimonas sediminum]SDK31060.1 ketopantoate reductase [Ferrimonas sediminum]